MAYFAKEFITSFNWFIRSLKKGDWIWLMVAIIIASTTVTIVKQLGDTVQQSMLRKAAVTLGADLVIKSTRPINTQWQRRAQALGLKTQEEITLTTMALINRPESEPGFQMIQLKAISDLQPLRGKRALNPIENPRFNNRDSTEMVWLSSRLQSIQDIQSKDTLTLGTKTFTVEIAPLEIYRAKPNRDASRIFPTTHRICYRTDGSIKRPSGVMILFIYSVPGRKRARNFKVI